MEIMGKKILYIENDIDDLNAVKTNLRKYGIEVYPENNLDLFTKLIDPVYDSKSNISEQDLIANFKTYILNENKFDLIILDWQLYDNKVKFAGPIINIIKNFNIPIIIITVGTRPQQIEYNNYGFIYKKDYNKFSETIGKNIDDRFINDLCDTIRKNKLGLIKDILGVDYDPTARRIILKELEIDTTPPSPADQEENRNDNERSGNRGTRFSDWDIWEAKTRASIFGIDVASSRINQNSRFNDENNTTENYSISYNISLILFSIVQWILEVVSIIFLFIVGVILFIKKIYSSLVLYVNDKSINSKTIDLEVKDISLANTDIKLKLSEELGTNDSFIILLGNLISAIELLFIAPIPYIIVASYLRSASIRHKIFSVSGIDYDKFEEKKVFIGSLIGIVATNFVKYIINGENNISTWKELAINSGIPILGHTITLFLLIYFYKILSKPH